MSWRIGALPFALALAACGGTDQASEPAATDSAAVPAADASIGDLAAYVGKYPFEEVDGVTWNDNAVVRAGIENTVTDAAVRRAIVETEGPSAPIELIGGKVAAWGCQQHNCGPHQWTVLVDPANGAVDVCYFSEDADSGNARWFVAGGGEEKRAGNCQLTP